ncbi:MAG: hypothetical protein AAF974_03875 [Cyanobacteria bacterium P01_E01_bin.34]
MENSLLWIADRYRNDNAAWELMTRSHLRPLEQLAGMRMLADDWRLKAIPPT